MSIWQREKAQHAMQEGGRGAWCSSPSLRGGCSSWGGGSLPHGHLGWGEGACRGPGEPGQGGQQAPGVLAGGRSSELVLTLKTKSVGGCGEEHCRRGHSLCLWGAMVPLHTVSAL